MKKQIYAQTVIGVATDMAHIREKIADLNKAYADRGYAANGSNPLTDADLASASLEVTASQFSDFISGFAVRLDAMMTGAAQPSAIDCDAIINEIRNDF